MQTPETIICSLCGNSFHISFGIESLLKGVKSYQYSRNGSFDDDRFMNFSLWQVNYQIKDLNQLKASIQDGSYDKNFNNKSVSSYINDMYQPYTYDAFNRFLEIIRQDSLL